MGIFKQGIKQFFTGCDNEDKFYYFEETKDWEGLIEGLKESTVDAFGEGFEFCDTQQNVEFYFDHTIIDMLTIDFTRFEPLDMVHRINVIDLLPDWIRNEYDTEIQDAKDDLESGHGCSFCSGSGEGSYDGSTCHVCKGSGQIEYKGIFEGEW